MTNKMMPIKFGDEAQNGMSRKEVIQFIVRLTGAKEKKSENHFDWMIRNQHLPQLKNFGRVQKAQATTTKRACIRVEQQLRWHNTTETVWEEHRLFNQPTDEFLALQPHFQLNLDETCVKACITTGNLKIVGSAAVKKHEKTTSDNKKSITIMRIGSPSGASGPWIFLIKKQTELEKQSPLRNLMRSFPNVPPGSVVIPTPNAYMTNDNTIKIAPIIAKGIRNMPIIKNHPEWKVCLTLDGFSSHLVPDALPSFTDALIEVVKEEGDTSQVNQAYDQSVAKEDKKHISAALDKARSIQVLNQETVVAACIYALNLVPAESWVSSFKKVNLHPHHRVDFTTWCKKIESKLKTGEQFFKNRVGLWDAMPAFWKAMPPEHCHLVVAMIDRLYENSKVAEGENSSPWTFDNICQLIQFVAIDNIEQLQGCYLTTKIDPSVMVGEPNKKAVMEAEAAEAEQQNASLLCNYNFSWKPKRHMDAVAKEREINKEVNTNNTAAAEEFFNHITNFVSRSHCTKTRERQFLEPKGYLDVEVTEDQRYFLQPTPADVLVGNILDDSIGMGAKKKIAKHRIDFITGNVASYCRSLNNPNTLQLIIDTNKLASCLATINESKELAKDAAREKKAAEAKKRKPKKDQDQAEFESKKAKVYDQLNADVSKGLSHVCSLRKKELQNLLKYYFEDKTPNQSKMNRTELVKLVKDIIDMKNKETNADQEDDGGDKEGGLQQQEEEEEEEMSLNDDDDSVGEDDSLQKEGGAAVMGKRKRTVCRRECRVGVGLCI